MRLVSKHSILMADRVPPQWTPPLIVWLWFALCPGMAQEPHKALRLSLCGIDTVTPVLEEHPVQMPDGVHHQACFAPMVSMAILPCGPVFLGR